jgi:hypothetical protein
MQVFISHLCYYHLSDLALSCYRLEMQSHLYLREQLGERCLHSLGPKQAVNADLQMHKKYVKIHSCNYFVLLSITFIHSEEIFLFFNEV